MQTPEKRPLSSPLKSPTKKDIIAGYVIDASAISKGDHAPYYNIQFQTAEDVIVKMKGYNITLHKTILGYQASGQRVKMEVRRSDTGLTYGSYCKVYKASVIDVPFELNTALKENIMAGKISRKITCAELKTIDPTTNKETFSMEVRVNIGIDDMDEIETVYGPSKVKRDIIIQDNTGTFPMQLFESKLKAVKDGESYHINSCLLKKVKGDIFIGFHGETTVTAIPPIQGLNEVTGLSKPKTVHVDAFDSIRDIRVFYPCPSCKKPIDVVDYTAEWIVCLTPLCNAENRVLKLDLHGTCLVKFDVDNKEHWAKLFNAELVKVLGKVVSDTQIKNHLKSMRDFKVVLFKDVIKDIIVNEAEAKDKENREDEENEKDENKDQNKGQVQNENDGDDIFQ